MGPTEQKHLSTPHSVGLLWTSISLSHRPLPDNTQHSQETTNHVFGGIRTRITSKLAAADLRLRPRGHSDRPFWNFVVTKIQFGIRFYSATVRQIEMFVRQLPTKVRIRCMKGQDRLYLFR